MPHSNKIFVFGASGHAKVVIDIIEKQGNFGIEFLVDDNQALHNMNFYGYQVLGGKQDLLDSGLKYGVVAIGNNKIRCSIANWLTVNGFQLVSIVHPSAQLGRGVVLGNNCVVMAGAVINSDCIIGNSVIINTKASIDHDCQIGDGVHIAPGAILCGSVNIGVESFVCAGSTIVPNRSVGCNVIIGAGSVVLKDISDHETVVGCPAKSIVR